MITIPISGIIARFEYDAESNVTPESFKKSLSDANGEDVLITINSPGGSVWEGLEMFSMIQNYSGKTETRVISLAASMGSILALAGNKRSIENTAMYFIHNAQGGGYGDHRDLAEASEWLKDVSTLLANIYSEYTALTLKEAQNLMNKDTHFFGEELKSLGFETIETGNELNNAVARVQAVKRIGEIENKISQDDFLNDLQKVAASISPKKNLDKFLIQNNSKILNEKTPATGGEQNKKQEVVMTLDELKVQHPHLYNQIFQAGEESGAKKERGNVSAHMKWLDVAPEAVASAIEKGEEFSHVHLSAYTKASMNKSDLDKRDKDNPDTGLQSDNKNGADANLDAFNQGMSGALDFGEEE